jgi:hypothetical protein
MVESYVFGDTCRCHGALPERWLPEHFAAGTCLANPSTDLFMIVREGLRPPA